MSSPSEDGRASNEQLRTASETLAAAAAEDSSRSTQRHASSTEARLGERRGHPSGDEVAELDTVATSAMSAGSQVAPRDWRQDTLPLDSSELARSAHADGVKHPHTSSIRSNSPTTTAGARRANTDDAEQGIDDEGPCQDIGSVLKHSRRTATAVTTEGRPDESGVSGDDAPEACAENGGAPAPLLDPLLAEAGASGSRPIAKEGARGDRSDGSRVSFPAFSPAAGTTPVKSSKASSRQASAATPGMLTAAAAAGPSTRRTKAHTGATATAAATTPAPRWRKVLYERQPFEDNYVDPRQFLEDLRENENVRGYEYWDVSYNTLVIVQQVSLVALFTCAFVMVVAHKDGDTDAGSGYYTLAWLDAAILVVAWVMYVQYRKQARKQFDDSDLILFHGEYARNARAAGATASSTSVGNATHASGSGTGGSSGRVGNPALSQSHPHLAGLGGDAGKGRSPHFTPPSSGAALSSPEDSVSRASPYGSPLGQHVRAGGGSQGRRAEAGKSPLGSSASPIGLAGGAHSSNAQSSVGAAAGRPFLIVKDGSEQAHGDVPLTLGYISDFGRKVISLGTFIVLLTPVLSTLTVTYSTDTIIALSILTMCLHVLLADYSYLNGYTEKYAPNFSVNSALFGVILMASRIPSPLQSGSLIAFGAFCFSLSPIARHAVKQYSRAAHVALTVCLFALAAFFLSAIPILCFLFVTAMALIALVIPWWFVTLHSSVKYQISGPWDEAKPTNSAAAAEWANAGLLG